jgi:hypothetical protein
VTGPVQRPSARVRLEASLLDAEGDAASPAAAARLTTPRLTVLVVAAEADLRRYVRECLRDRPELHVVEAATAAAAAALAATHAVALVVVDDETRDALDACPACGAVLLVDDPPRGAAASGGRVRLLGRPFTAEELGAEVERLIE